MWKPQKPRHASYKKEVFSKVIATCSFIYHLGETEALREKSEPVKKEEFNSKNLNAQISYLKRCLRSYRKRTGVGRGITAVQVGVKKRFALIYMPEATGEFMIIINPKITKRSNESYSYPEMCMSANPVIAPVIRPAWIEFEYQDENGIFEVDPTFYDKATFQKV